MHPTFVVGTGRCGSTMLSNMLRRHPRILSVSECFPYTCDLGGRIPSTFTTEPIDGRQFFALIGAIGPRASLMLRHDVTMPEVLYPHTAPESRYSAKTGVPAWLQVVLPHVTDNPDELFDELRAQLVDRPRAAIAEHYKHAFGWLAQRFERTMWIERSGGAFVVIEPIFATFPDARFIHIVRDGRDTALSISEHFGFRMFLMGAMLTEMLGVDPYESDDRSNIDQVPAPMRAFLPERFDAQAFRDYRVPVPVCAGLWSQQIANGMGVLGQLSDDRVLTVRYEDFFTEPQAQMDRIAGFLGDQYIDSAWSADCADMVRPPKSSWRQLGDVALQALDTACQPGFDLLRAAGIEY